jgi:hypothetical protein
MNVKSIFILFLLSIQVSSFAQSNDLKKSQGQAVKKLIATFKSKNKIEIAERLSYPLRREYPLKDVRNKSDFLQRFDEIFDASFMERIGKSKITDWSEVGWRGIMFDQGDLWIDDNGRITRVNYLSTKEAEQLANAIKTDKDLLPLSLRNFQKPLYVILTKNYKIRIDQTGEDMYRYASWKSKNDKGDADLVIHNGRLQMDGSGGNHSLAFENNGHSFVIYINVLGDPDTAEAELEVTKEGKRILMEKGKIKRN